MRSVVRSSLLFGLFFGPGYFILGGDDASIWLMLAWIAVATYAAGAIDRWLERRASD